MGIFHTNVTCNLYFQCQKLQFRLAPCNQWHLVLQKPKALDFVGTRKHTEWAPDALPSGIHHFSRSSQNFENLIFKSVAFLDSKWSSFKLINNKLFCMCCLTCAVCMFFFTRTHSREFVALIEINDCVLDLFQ